MSLLEEFNRLVDEAEAEYRWQWHLHGNELLWGSAYGPWLPPKLQGLAAICWRDE